MSKRGAGISRSPTIEIVQVTKVQPVPLAHLNKPERAPLIGFREWERSTRNESEKIDAIGWSMFAARRRSQ